jgi:mannose-6-phosphate isomerase-like protein (cupin superfamily)
MPDRYSLVNLVEIEDVAPANGFAAAAEEIYVILGGTGRVKLDDEIFDVRPLDAIRVQPDVARAFEAGGDGLEFLAFGPHHPG